MKDIFELFSTFIMLIVYIAFIVRLEWWLVLIFAMLFAVSFFSGKLTGAYEKNGQKRVVRSGRRWIILPDAPRIFRWRKI